MSATGDRAPPANVNSTAKDAKATSVMGGVGGKPLNMKNDGNPSFGVDAFDKAASRYKNDPAYTKIPR